ncbi:hypothetical protein GGR57DRAFT_82768 [Xylariaceae sp. FL1272]|nr:hypothetical protein GGR57DRAFT_82768 [Xylariaceae sp. FL1272]
MLWNDRMAHALASIYRINRHGTSITRRSTRDHILVSFVVKPSQRPASNKTCSEYSQLQIVAIREIIKSHGMLRII